VRPHVVVEEAELTQCLVERLQGIHREPVELVLQRPEETFDPSVLPGGVSRSEARLPTRQASRANFVEDEGRPLAIAVQTGIANCLELLPLRAVVVSVKEKGREQRSSACNGDERK
jgi:hypothetical protein